MRRFAHTISKKLLPSFNRPTKINWAEENNSYLSVHDVIYPIFLSDKKNSFEKVDNFPNQFKIGVEKLPSFLEPLSNKGLKSVLLFGSIDDDKKDLTGSWADRTESPVIEGVTLIKKYFPDILVICDVCLCAYTSHGNCGIIDEPLGKINIEKSIKRLGEVSQNYALAGCDIVAPSDMLDNRVAVIDEALRNCHKRYDVSIMSYAAKFSSNLYGPFRYACNSSYGSKIKRTNQLPYGSSLLAQRAIERDIKEGADFIIVKPGLFYLDIITEAKKGFAKHVPIIAYQVSGEYAMIHYASQNNAIDLKESVLESLVCFKRAGASAIITYFAPQILDWI